jgi:hypothetical protein
MRSRKAQFWSFDALFAMIIFTAAVLIATDVWYSVSNQFAVSYGYGVGNMEMQLNSFSTQLLGTGYPSNWDSQISISNTLTWNNISIGLGNQNNGYASSSLSESKVMTLYGMSNYNYQATKTQLGLSYDYYITFSGSGVDLSIGKNPLSGGATAIEVSNRFVTLNNKTVEMRVLVWTNTTFGVS